MKQSHANRGRSFEAGIERACAIYAKSGLGMIQKIPTPVRQSSRRGGDVKFWRERSTVDFIGVYRGIPVAFDAKETAAPRYDLSALRDHQMRFLADFRKAGGLAFVLVHFRLSRRVVAIDPWWAMGVASSMDRKSIPADVIENMPSCEAVVSVDKTSATGAAVGFGRAVEFMASSKGLFTNR